MDPSIVSSVIKPEDNKLYALVCNYIKLPSYSYQPHMINIQPSCIHTSVTRKQPSPQHISTLYQQFESLKSQIYPSKSLKDQNGVDRSLKKNHEYYEADSQLRQRSIRKYSQQFKDQIQMIKETKKHAAHKHSRSDIKQLLAASASVSQITQFGKKEERLNRLTAYFIQKISNETSFAHKKRDGSQTQNQNKRGLKETADRESMTEGQFKEILRNGLKWYQDYQKQLLFTVLEQLDYVNRKMAILQKLVIECSKIIKFTNQIRKAKQQEQNRMIINIKDIESRYQTQMGELVKHYEQKISQLQQNKSQFAHLGHSEKCSDSLFALQQENFQLGLIVQQNKELLQSKQQQLAKLQQQNSNLRKLIFPNGNNEKEDLSLDYSPTEFKIKVSSQIVRPNQLQKHQLIDLQCMQEEINFNELDSATQKSFEDSNISQLYSRRKRNMKSSKSMGADFTQSYDDIDQSQ